MIVVENIGIGNPSMQGKFGFDVSVSLTARTDCRGRVGETNGVPDILLAFNLD